VGAVIWHLGQRYRVVHVVTHDHQSASITVEPDSGDIGDLLSSERGGIELTPVD
jgi:hypothetical protein